MFAGVELGGTKSIAVIARGPAILDRIQVPTTSAKETLPAIADALTDLQARHGAANALGIAGFGPLRISHEAHDFGHMLGTPKPGWAGADVFGALAPAVRGPAQIDTDVNGAAMAEGLWGASRGCRVHAYVTIGTGIGAGLVTDGLPAHGLLHPELGHVRVRRVAGDTFPGICPFHGDCLEGLASGPAIAARAGAPAETLPSDHPVWTLLAGELAEAMTQLILILSVQRIVIGGGVGSGCKFLLPRIVEGVRALLAGYGPAADPTIFDGLIVHPGLGGEAGPLGSIALARSALLQS